MPDYKAMKILHLCISAFYIDNYSYQENILPKYHAKMGHDVTIIASTYSYDDNGKPCYLRTSSGYLNTDGIKVIRIDYKKPILLNKILRRYNGLYQAIDKIAPDLIFTHNISAVDMHQLYIYMKKHPNTKLYGDNHADYINSGKNMLSRYILHPIIWRHYALEIEPYMQKCFGVTPMRCRFLREVYHIPNEKIEFLPMGIDDEAIPTNKEEIKNEMRLHLGISNRNFIIFTGGKIDKLKNTHILIEAIQQLDNQRVHLVICGTLTPEMKYLKKFSKYQNIHFMGWCNAKEVMKYMIASDIACFPGTHSTLWEQCVGIGLPAIFKRWPEMEHVNVNGNCIFIKGDDVNELSHAIRLLVFSQEFDKIRLLANKAASHFRYSEIAKKSIGI